MRRFLIGTGIGILAALAALEGGLRLLPVASGARMEATSDSRPYSRYLPAQDYLYSYGWAMCNARKGSSNQQGFTNSISHAEPGGLLVIGDSFIESLMLNYGDTLQGQLEARLPNKVVAASASGNGLADALKIVEALADESRPAKVILFVEPTDLSELLEPALKGHSGFIVRNGQVSVGHQPYVESPYKATLSHSALIRYLYYNLKFPEWLSMKLAPKMVHAAQDIADQSAQKTLVLEYFLSRLQELGREKDFQVIFLVDGDRRAIYANLPGGRKSWNDAERELLLRLAPRYGHEVIDMQPVFFQHWRQMGERLDWLPMDGHWNAAAHALAAQQVLTRIGAD